MYTDEVKHIKKEESNFCGNKVVSSAKDEAESSIAGRKARSQVFQQVRQERQQFLRFIERMAAALKMEDAGGERSTGDRALQVQLRNNEILENNQQSKGNGESDRGKFHAFENHVVCMNRNVQGTMGDDANQCSDNAEEDIGGKGQGQRKMWEAGYNHEKDQRSGDAVTKTTVEMWEEETAEVDQRSGDAVTKTTVEMWEEETAEVDQRSGDAVTKTTVEMWEEETAEVDQRSGDAVTKTTVDKDGGKKLHQDKKDIMPDQVSDEIEFNIFSSPFRALAESCGFKVIKEDTSFHDKNKEDVSIEPSDGLCKSPQKTMAKKGKDKDEKKKQKEKNEFASKPKCHEIKKLQKIFQEPNRSLTKSINVSKSEASLQEMSENIGNTRSQEHDEKGRKKEKMDADKQQTLLKSAFRPFCRAQCFIDPEGQKRHRVKGHFTFDFERGEMANQDLKDSTKKKENVLNSPNDKTVSFCLKKNVQKESQHTPTFEVASEVSQATTAGSVSDFSMDTREEVIQTEVPRRSTKIQYKSQEKLARLQTDKIINMFQTKETPNKMQALFQTGTKKEREYPCHPACHRFIQQNSEINSVSDTEIKDIMKNAGTDIGLSELNSNADTYVTEEATISAQTGDSLAWEPVASPTDFPSVSGYKNMPICKEKDQERPSTYAPKTLRPDMDGVLKADVMKKEASGEIRSCGTQTALSIESPAFSFLTTLTNRNPFFCGANNNHLNLDNARWNGNINVNNADVGGGTSFVGQYLFELWRNQCLCDIRIRVGNSSYLAHTLVLAAFSDKFCEDPQALPSRVFDISDSTPEAVHQILLYLYTAEMEITENTLEDVLNAADALGINEVVKLCEQILCNPTLDNLHLYMDIRTRRGMPGTLLDFPQIYRDHFSDMVASRLYLELDIESLEGLLQDTEIKVESEAEVIEAIATWIEYQPLERTDKAAYLLQYVKFECMCPEELAEVVDKKKYIFDYEATTILMEAFKDLAVRYGNDLCKDNKAYVQTKRVSDETEKPTFIENAKKYTLSYNADRKAIVSGLDTDDPPYWRTATYPKCCAQGKLGSSTPKHGKGFPRSIRTQRTDSGRSVWDKSHVALHDLSVNHSQNISSRAWTHKPGAGQDEESRTDKKGRPTRQHTTYKTSELGESTQEHNSSRNRRQSPTEKFTLRDGSVVDPFENTKQLGPVVDERKLSDCIENQFPFRSPQVGTLKKKSSGDEMKRSNLAMKLMTNKSCPLIEDEETQETSKVLSLLSSSKATPTVATILSKNHNRYDEEDNEAPVDSEVDGVTIQDSIPNEIFFKEPVRLSRHSSSSKKAPRSQRPKSVTPLGFETSNGRKVCFS